MTRILGLCLVVVTIMFITGCQSSYVSQPSSSLQVVTSAELTPDISVGEKIQATATVHRFLYFFSWGPGKFAEGVNYGSNLSVNPVSSSICGNSINEAKAAAAYSACTDNKADFIICPRYYIITDNYLVYKRTRAKVFGYKGVLLGVKIPEHESTIQSIELIKPIQIAEPIKLANPIKVILPEAKSAPNITKIVKAAQ